MAKHLGNRRQPRLGAGPTGRRAWYAAAGFAVVSTVTVVAIAQGMASGDTAHTVGAGADPGSAGQPVANHTSSDSATRGPGDPASASPGSTAGRRVDVSRQADRPRVSTHGDSSFRVRPGTRLSLTRTAALARKVADNSPAHASFTIAQSNVLGSQHTTSKGGYGPGPARAALTSSLLTARGVDVGGMQEVQTNQLAVFRTHMPSYSFWPGTSLGNNGVRLQIYWRTSQFTMEKSGSITYTFASQRIPLPYVLLRDDATGAEFWMITTHNSAGGMQGQRDAATTAEIGLINQLRATGVPVIIVGDMNEHTEFFCRVAAGTGMVAANGGNGVGGCHLPPPPLRVDWIMGGGEGAGSVSFSGYRQDAAGLHRASDHYYLYSEVTTTSRWFAPSTAP
ncbi:MAG TPA: endonuclease/exonuclease/phosphatase family protein [Nocardioides sp.]|jgi:endonuclease/exonuclease/phosphatase family metal-dependent hydrolase|uniref:endonuclease/exonuclease/phosphatase family protein n=1 Tax=Nocardioides sp. TaxID=35761 RepID=UPI002E37C933|nr:endonuclease/exonuclease/phosphatase family protein [Nocardioides sp.]HEX3932374.1 endonuclease/exonuclease/phosphatase family protein [Nocardioides sp.]